MELKDGKNAVEALLMTYKGEMLDVCYQVYMVICSVDEQWRLLKHFFECSQYIVSNKTKEIDVYFSDKEIKDLKKQYSKLIDGLLEKLLQKKLEKDDFYKELWENINSDIVFEGGNAKAYAIYNLFADIRMPYYKIGEGLRMSDEAYKKTFDGLLSKISEAKFILAYPMEQRTQIASLLVDLIEGMDSMEKKAVLMAQIIELVRLIYEPHAFVTQTEEESEL